MFLFSLEEKVLPGRMQEYAGYTKEMIGLIRGLDPGIAFSAFGSDEGYMDYNQRVENPCDFGPMLERWGKIQEASLATEWGPKRLGALEWSRYSLWEHLAELSYTPRHPNPDPHELAYYLWKNVLVNASKEREFAETGRQVRAFLEQKEIGRGYRVFRNRIGYEAPLYSVVFAGKDPVDAAKFLMDTAGALGLSLMPFFYQIMAMVERTTDFQGWAMPELSLSVK